MHIHFEGDKTKAIEWFGFAKHQLRILKDYMNMREMQVCSKTLPLMNIGVSVFVGSAFGVDTIRIKAVGAKLYKLWVTNSGYRSGDGKKGEHLENWDDQAYIYEKHSQDSGNLITQTQEYAFGLCITPDNTKIVVCDYWVGSVEVFDIAGLSQQDKPNLIKYEYGRSLGAAICNKWSADPLIGPWTGGDYRTIKAAAAKDLIVFCCAAMTYPYSYMVVALDYDLNPVWYYAVPLSSNYTAGSIEISGDKVYTGWSTFGSSYPGYIGVNNLADGSILSGLDIDPAGPPFIMDISVYGDILYAADLYNQRVCMWNIKTGHRAGDIDLAGMKDNNGNSIINSYMGPVSVRAHEDGLLILAVSPASHWTSVLPTPPGGVQYWNIIDLGNSFKVRRSEIVERPGYMSDTFVPMDIRLQEVA
jgi:hypothetical protein